MIRIVNINIPSGFFSFVTLSSSPRYPCQVLINQPIEELESRWHCHHEWEFSNYLIPSQEWLGQLESDKIHWAHWVHWVHWIHWIHWVLSKKALACPAPQGPGRNWMCWPTCSNNQPVKMMISILRLRLRGFHHITSLSKYDHSKNDPTNDEHLRTTPSLRFGLSGFLPPSWGTESA